MKKLEWDKTLSVEVAEIDEDHRRLLDPFNLFATSVSTSRSSATTAMHRA